MDDLKLLRDALPEMASIINAEEGQVFSIGSADALLILQRKIKESDMKEELGIYNAIFAKQHGALVSDITESAVAFVKVMNAYEVYGKLLQENGLSLSFKDASKDDERSYLTGGSTYLIHDSDVIKLMLSGETYDEITAQNVYVQVSKDGLPEYFSAEVTYRYNDWMITKSLYLQVTIEDREEGANEN